MTRHVTLTDDETDYLLEGLQLVWRERMEIIAKNPRSFKVSDVREFADAVATLRSKLGENTV